MGKKTKTKKQSQALSVPAQVQLAEKQLQDGRFQDAINTLFRVEAEFRHYTSQGKGQTLPPHLANLQPTVAPLMGQAMFARALAAESVEARIKDLQEALIRTPENRDYLLGLGICQMLAENHQQAWLFFEQAQQRTPDDPLVKGGFILGLLASGKTREVRDALKALPEEALDPRLHRLFAMRDFFIGNNAQATERLRNSASAKGSAVSHIFDAIISLSAGDLPIAQQRLNQIPTFDRNPSTGELAALATQFFYKGALCFELGNFEQAATALFEAEDLARKIAVNLPFLERLAAYYHKIAAATQSPSNLTVPIACWQRAQAINAKDQAAAANLRAAQQVEGNRAWREGRVAEALEIWQKALHLKPQDERLLTNIAAACEQLERSEDAIIYWRSLARIWRQTLKREFDDALKERLLVLEKHIIEKMMKADRPNHEVIAELDAALSLDATNAETRRQYIEFYFDIGQPKQALKHIEYLERHEAESAALLTQKGLALEMTRKSAAAQKCFARALELEPHNALARQAYIASLDQEGQKALEKSQYARAVEICQKQLELDPTLLLARANLANIYFEMDEAESAEKVLQQAIESSPDDAYIRVTIGGIYFSNGYTKTAQELFQKAEELDPSPECLFKIGNEYLSKCKHQEGIKYFERAAKTASLDLLFEMCLTLVEHDDDKKVEKSVNRIIGLAIKKDPSHPLPHLIKVPRLLIKAKVDQAQSALNEAERLVSEKKEFASFKADIDEFRKAIKALRHLIENTGMPPELLGLLGRMDLD